jgi:N-methylhydantoinase A
LPLHIAADIGGTFTDFVAYDDGGSRFETAKVLTTYPDRAIGLLEGFDDVLRRCGARPSAVASFTHGSTVATNTLVERTGARLALITTHGFRDLLELRRQRRPHLFDLQADKPTPLVERPLRYEVRERVLFDGSVHVPLDEDDVHRAVDALLEQGVEAVAVTYLHAYANPRHEDRTRRIIERRAPHLIVTTSSEVLPEFREFERLSTTVVNAYVAPAVRSYLVSLRGSLERRGCMVPPLVMKGDGGVASPEEAGANAVATVGSGPAGGVRGAVRAAGLAAAGGGSLITFDMGGTSTDVALVKNGQARMSDERAVAGWPVKGMALEVESIGAGGGSLAWIDGGGLLQVGPQSAGSTPGPACYRRGGRDPTITDANLVLGRVDTLLGGSFPLDLPAARAAIDRAIAAPLGMTVEEASLGILAVANAQMVGAIRLLTVEQGHDPRDSVLVAYGGAGPLHAPAVARELGITEVVVPPHCGVLSALGVLTSDRTRSFSVTRLVPLADDRLATMAEIFGELEARARTWIDSVGNDAGGGVTFSADVRCRGQNYELGVDAGEVALQRAPAVDDMARRFHAAHRAAYGHAFEGAELECVTFRAHARVVTRAGAGSPDRVLAGPPPGPAVPSSAGDARRVIWEHGSVTGHTTAVFVAASLRPGATVEGPAIVERPDATIAVLPGQLGESHPSGAFVIREGE